MAFGLRFEHEATVLEELEEQVAAARGVAHQCFLELHGLPKHLVGAGQLGRALRRRRQVFQRRLFAAGLRRKILQRRSHGVGRVAVRDEVDQPRDPLASARYARFASSAAHAAVMIAGDLVAASRGPS